MTSVEPNYQLFLNEDGRRLCAIKPLGSVLLRRTVHLNLRELKLTAGIASTQKASDGNGFEATAERMCPSRARVT